VVREQGFYLEAELLSAVIAAANDDDFGPLPLLGRQIPYYAIGGSE
jgi:hypothetical protein